MPDTNWLPVWLHRALQLAAVALVAFMATALFVNRLIPDVGDMLIGQEDTPQLGAATTEAEIEDTISAAPPPPDYAATAPPCEKGGRWRCYQDPYPRSNAHVPRVTAMYVGQTPLWFNQMIAMFGLPDVSLHPSAGVVLHVTDLDTWTAQQDDPFCEGHLRLHLNGHRLEGLLPTQCDLSTGRVFFQLRNLDLQSDTTPRDQWQGGWQAVLDSRSHTFWTNATFSVSWDDMDHLPTDVGWDSRAILWLLPPVNAWIALAAISFALVLVATLGRYTRLLREGGPKGPFSLSRVQGAWWFLCIFSAWEILCAFKRDIVPLDPAALLMLGIAGGTYTWSVGVMPQPPTAYKAGSRGFWQDIVSDHEGPVMHRLQLIAWALALGVAYVYGTVVELAMPQIDESLLVLMGISSAGYLTMRKSENASAPTDLPPGAPPAEPPAPPTTPAPPTAP